MATDVHADAEVHADVRPAREPRFEGLPIIDCDVHNSAGTGLEPYLPQRWRDYLSLVGVRTPGVFEGVRSTYSVGDARLDTVPPGGGAPASDPEFARHQLLDEYGLTFAILENLEAMRFGNAPAELEIELARAVNDYNHDVWLESDPRWLASINIPTDHPEAAVKELIRCRERSDRYIQVVINPMSERPLGNPKYWPIYEAATALDIPIAIHIAFKHHNSTGVGESTFYYEVRTSIAAAAQAVVPSMIFEGVFDRFPDLKIIPSEVGWSWAVPMAWRLDSSWRVMREEVPHLQRKPSDYLRDHFWFTIQPGVEPPRTSNLLELHDQFERVIGDRLVFATDYPHWDMNSPFTVLPPQLDRERTAKILGGNASEVYGLNLGSGA